jgi:hypothetical protein
VAVKKRDFSDGPDWRKSQCRTDPEARDYDFFTELWHEAMIIKTSFCARCPIAHECLQFALTYNEQGIWGNTTDDERKALKRHVERVHCPGCASTDIIDMGKSEICISCGLSWLT